METKTMFIAPNEGETIEMMGITMTVKQDLQKSNGMLSIIEQSVNPQAGSPLHICGKEDKIIYVLEGDFLIRIGTGTVQASKGATAVIAKGVVHNFKNVGTTTGKLLVTLTPGGHENFLKDLSSSVQQYGKNVDRMKEVAQKHSVTLC